MSPHCQNCGSFVTKDYVRVFTPESADSARCCPACRDNIRDIDGTVRDARSPRDGKATIENVDGDGVEA